MTQGAKQQCIGITLLVVLIIGAVLFVHFVPQHRFAQEQILPELCLDSSNYTSTYHPQLFDPNTADSTTMLASGLKPWQIHNLLRYRMHGGRFRSVDDFSRLYGLSESDFLQIKPFIRIDTMPFYLEELRYQNRRDSLFAARKHRFDSIYQADSLRWDSLAAKLKPAHPKKDTILELNSADTTDLQWIRGIGAYTALAIVHFREQLGGFYSPEQLRELAADNPQLSALDTLLSHFTADRDSIHTISVNHSSLNRLCRHPYINYKQAEAIYTARRKAIRLESFNQIRQLEVFTEDELARLEPYLDFKR